MNTRTEVFRIGNFLAGGGLIALFGMGLLFVLVQGAHLGYNTAFAIQLAITLALNFAYNRHITWRDVPGHSLRSQGSRYLATRGFSQALSMMLFAGLVSTGIGMNYLAANVVCQAGATAFNYYTSNSFVFAADTAKTGQLEG